MYKLDKLFEDLVKTKGPLRKGGPLDKTEYEKVWDAFNRYLTVTHQKRQTLNVHNFCKIGWKIEELNGKAKLRPHFQFADSFLRVFNIDAKAHPIMQDRHLTAVEEFNYSKAAIRYSQSLTKDNIFMGLRAIVHQIGDAAAREQVCIDFEIGRLLCSEREAQFVFTADIYVQEGLEVPAGALEDVEYTPSVTFGPPSKDAMSLSVLGSNQVPRSIKANSLGGWEDLDLSPRSQATNETQIETQLSRLTGSPAEARSQTVSPAAADMTRHLAHVAALSRHIGQMEEDATKAIAEKNMWEGHLERCTGLEQKALEWKRSIEKDHAEQLKLQIKQDDEKRAKERDDYKTKNNMHNFPCFKEPGDGDIRSYLHERREGMRKDLDQQVESRNKMQHLQKQRDLELEWNNIEASQFEIQKIRSQEVAKKHQERAILAQAWDQDVRLKTVKKAIEDHHKTPNPKSILSGLVSNLGSSAKDGGSVVSPTSVTSPVPPIPSPPRLDTPGALSDRSSLASSRSSARRRPIGAAASLSLQKEKMKSSSRR